MLRNRRWAMLLGLLVSFSLVAAACGNDDDDTASNGDADDASQDTADLEDPDVCDVGDNFTPPESAGGATEALTAEELEAEGLLAPEGTLSGRIEGAGATFPNPLWQDWSFDYADSRSGVARQPDVSIEYQSIGSGGGIEQFLRDTQDWGTSERYLRDDALAEASENRGGTEAIQVPMVYGSVVIAFSDPQFDGLVLDAEAVADIFLRNITSFADERIAELNPGCDFPDIDIVPVHRSDGSGTTSVFTVYLEDESEAWQDFFEADGTEASGTEVNWVSGTVGGQGNEGVTANIQNAPGGLGYINQAYALENGLPQARLINNDGNAVYPTLEATTEAIEGLDIPDDFQFDILGIGGDGYPITGTVWNFYYTSGYDDATAEVLRDYWIWATQSAEADELALELGYAPLGASLKSSVLETLLRINEG